MAKEVQIRLSEVGAELVKGALGDVDMSMKGLAKSAGMMIGAYFGTQGVISALKYSVQQSIAGEASARKLEVAYGKSTKALQDFANQRQRVTRFDDDGTIAAMAAISAFTKEERSVKALTIAAQDLAEAKGMDLVSAAELLGRTFGSTTNALARSGIEVNATAGSMERLKQITKGVADLYGGQAAAAADTLGGRMAQAQNAMDNMAQAVGDRLAPTLKGLAELMTRIVTPKEPVYDDLTKASMNYNGALTLLTDKMAQLNLVAKDKDAKDTVRRAYMAMDVAALEQLLTANAGLDNEILDVIHSLETYNKLQKEKAARDAESAKGTGDATLQLKSQAEYEKELLEYQIEIARWANENSTTRNAALEEEAALSKALVDISGGGIEQWRLEYDEWRFLHEAKRDEINRTAQLQKMTNLQQVGGALGAIGQLNAAWKGSAVASKRLMQAQAVIDTYAGANRALGAYPPPFNFIAAAAVVASGLANVTMIEKQQFASGGYVRGHGGSRSDMVPAQLSAGEGVLNAATVARIGGEAAINQLNAGGGAGGGITIQFNGPVTDKAYVRDYIVPEVRRAVGRAMA